MAAYGTGRWLTKNQYQRIRNMAKKMGAMDVCFDYICHIVSFQYTSISFGFRPFQVHADILPGAPWHGNFADKEGADRIKSDMDKALEFMSYLRKFNEELEGV